MGKKLIYKKTVALNLVKLGHDLLYTAKNRSNEKYQVFFFTDTPELRKDLAMLTGHEYDENEIHKK
ncbi:hypothetical protein AB1K32_25395 [Metabacillus dongyingensis]|uniref:hypothetical protein n=1 Tax=Metabacillus dongyingensis TaxID=2874282 RepID=UPI003B8E62C7